MRILGFNRATFTAKHLAAFKKSVAFAMPGIDAEDVVVVDYMHVAGELEIEYRISCSNATAMENALAATTAWHQRLPEREVWGETVFKATIETEGAAIPPALRISGASVPSLGDEQSTDAPAVTPATENVVKPPQTPTYSIEIAVVSCAAFLAAAAAAVYCYVHRKHAMPERRRKQPKGSENDSAPGSEHEARQNPLGTISSPEVVRCTTISSDFVQSNPMYSIQVTASV
jgi:hypothetical protein